MAKAAAALTNFTAGELSPRLEGRTELAKYFNGCATLENMLVHPHGGAARRPGTIFVAEVKSSAAAVRLISFEFNVEQTYVLEFGNNYFRIMRDGGVVASGGSAVEVTTTYTTAQLTGLKFAQSADVMYVVHPDHPPRKITRTSHTAWTLTDVVFVRGPMQDQNLTETTLVASARSGSVTVTASANLFVATDVGRLIRLHEGYARITAFTNATTVTALTLEREDGLSELLPTYASNTISFHEGDPDSTGLEHNDRLVDSAKAFRSQGFTNNTKVTVTGAGTSGNNKNYLAVSVTDDTILLSPSDDVAAESASNTITLVGQLIAHKDWSLGAFSPTTGYPSAVSFYEERLAYAATATQPQTLFFSQSGDFDNFQDGVDDAEAMIYTIGSNQVNIIRYLASSRSLVVGTSGGEFAVRAGASDQALTPTNIQIKRQASYGSADIQPIQSGNATLFVQRAKRKLRELTYNFDSDSYQAPDLTILAEHVTETGINEIAAMQEPDNIIWAVLNDGTLCGMTYRREEEVVAWHRHLMGGTFTGVHSTFATGTYAYGLVENVATVPGDLDEDQTYVVVKRTINGATKRYIEYLNYMNFGANVKDAFFIDSGLSYTGVATTTAQDHSSSATSIVLTDGGSFASSGIIKIGPEFITYTGKSTHTLTGATRGAHGTAALTSTSGSVATQAAISLSGLTHLEGQTVKILTDGATHPDKTVSSGAISLNRPTTYAHVGLGYTSTLKTMRIEKGAQDGTAQGKIKRIHDVTVRFFRSVGAKVGSATTQTDVIPFRSSADEMNQPVPLFTGDKSVEFDGAFDTDGFVVVQQDQPLPMTILAIYPRLITFDE
jgi:hypothetical protein|tara:strand:- start:180 stop:2687 length:2508 start_codon:yes stop_codon:yes gene_type:complete